MKQKGNLWYFESYQEIRDYLTQGLNYLCHYVYLTTRQRAWVSNYGKVVADCNEEGGPYVLTDDDKAYEHHYVDRVINRDYSIPAGIGDIEDFPAEDYAVKKPWKVVEIEAATAVSGFYKAGDHLAEHAHTIGEERTKFTTKELTAVKNCVKLVNDEQVDYVYRIKTQTGRYQCHQDSLWLMMLELEKADGVSPAKRKAFTVKGQASQRDVILRLSFMADKDVQRLKQCLATDEQRPVMNYPAIETATGIILGTDGHILTAYNLKGYEQDAESGLPAWAQGLMNIPKEVCQMKGRVTVEAVEGKWEESKGNGTSELREVEGIIVTATDEKGRQAVVRQCCRFPNWRSVIPQKIGPSIAIDTKKLSDGLRRIMPQLNSSSERVTVSANAGDKSIMLSGEDYDFSKGGSVNVDVIGKVPCGMMVDLNARMAITAVGFAVKTMHYTDAGHALVFVGDDVFTIQVPMFVDGYKDAPRPTDKQLKRFSIDKWAGDCRKTDGNGDKPAARAKAKLQVSERHQPSAVAPQPSIEDRLRAVLRRQLAMAA